MKLKPIALLFLMFLSPIVVVSQSKGDHFLSYGVGLHYFNAVNAISAPNFISPILFGGVEVHKKLNEKLSLEYGLLFQYKFKRESYFYSIPPSTIQITNYASLTPSVDTAGSQRHRIAISFPFNLSYLLIEDKEFYFGFGIEAKAWQYIGSALYGNLSAHIDFGPRTSLTYDLGVVSARVSYFHSVIPFYRVHVQWKQEDPNKDLSFYTHYLSLTIQKPIFRRKRN